MHYKTKIVKTIVDGGQKVIAHLKVPLVGLALAQSELVLTKMEVEKIERQLLQGPLCGSEILDRVENKPSLWGYLNNEKD